MQLSKRLQTVADTVTKGNAVADVGCDHAYIAIYLIEKAIATKVIAMDINKGPLEKAKYNIKAKGLEDRIETRLSDGLDKLQQGEVDTILMAGMGGALMIRILENGREVRKGCKELVLSPQSEIDLVRKYLHDNLYAIKEEKMVLDEGKFYIIMRAIPVNEKESYDNEVFYQYGKLLLERKEPILKEYLQREQRIHKDILEKLKAVPGERSVCRLKEVENAIRMIEEAFSYFSKE